jgi:hypothetical protein
LDFLNSGSRPDEGFAAATSRHHKELIVDAGGRKVGFVLRPALQASEVTVLVHAAHGLAREAIPEAPGFLELLLIRVE